MISPPRILSALDAMRAAIEDLAETVEQARGGEDYPDIWCRAGVALNAIEALVQAAEQELPQ